MNFIKWRTNRMLLNLLSYINNNIYYLT